MIRDRTLFFCTYTQHLLKPIWNSKTFFGTLEHCVTARTRMLVITRQYLSSHNLTIHLAAFFLEKHWTETLPNCKRNDQKPTTLVDQISNRTWLDVAGCLLDSWISAWIFTMIRNVWKTSLSYSFSIKLDSSWRTLKISNKSVFLL